MLNLLNANILLCDDSRLDRTFATRSLLDEGFKNIHEATNWETAKKICLNERISCCIIDLLMNEGEGTELIKELRQLPGYNRVPMLIITASESEEKTWSCLKNGADDYITKPYHAKALAVRVKLHIERFFVEICYKDLIEYMSCGFIIYKPINNGTEFEFVEFNHAGENIDNIKREDIIGKKLTEAFPEVEEIGFLDVLKRVLQTGKPEKLQLNEYEYKNKHKTIWRDNFVYRLPDNEIVTIYDDRTEKMQALEELKRSNTRLRLAAEGARLGVWELDLIARKFLWDEWMYELYGVDPADFDLKYETWEKLVDPDDLKALNTELISVIADNKKYDGEFRITKPSGEVRYIKAHGIISLDESGTPCHLTGINYDITERRLAEIKLAESALRDSLTNLYNRRYLYQKLQELHQKHLRDSSVFTVALFDLDHFKSINDNYGHLTGDRILLHFSHLLTSSLRPYDVIARFGGEEFIAVFIDTDKTLASQICRRILEKLGSESLPAEDTVIQYSFTCGICDIQEFSGKALNIDQLILCADERLYRGKENGRKQIISE